MTDELTDELSVTGIECFGHHGVFEHERREGQAVRGRPHAGPRHPPRRRSDDLRDTVDYGSLVAAVKAAVENDPVDLIETLAQRIADVCLRDVVLNGHGSRCTSRTPPSRRRSPTSR